MNKIANIHGKIDLVALYEDLIDTALVLEAMRVSNPKKAISLSEYKKTYSHA